MTGFQLATTIGLPTTALVVMVLLLVIARPDRDPEGNSVYAGDGETPARRTQRAAISDRVIRVSGGGRVCPQHRVVNQHGAVVATLGDVSSFDLGRDWIVRVNEHHGDAVAFAPVKGLDCNSVRHMRSSAMVNVSARGNVP